MTWHEELLSSIRSVQELAPYFERLGVTEPQQLEIETAVRRTGVNIPRAYIDGLVDAAKTSEARAQVRALLLPGANPLLARNAVEGVVFIEPTDADHNPLRGLTRMYQDRVLIAASFHCMNTCQWCYRTKQDGTWLSDGELDAIVEYVAGDSRIRDVILTGGEPLLLPDQRLDRILTALRCIDHVDIVRFHTRAPVVLPSRIDDGLLSLVRKHSRKGKPIYIVTHYVHPLELTDRSTDALERLSHVGVPLLNQAPVLRGVNDDQETFDEWNRRMIQFKVKPYYVAAPVIQEGVNSRFLVPLGEVKSLLRAYSRTYDGLGRPTLIVPVMGAKLTPEELEAEMQRQGTHVRRTKIQIQ